MSGLVPLSIILGVMGCASTQTVTPPQPPAPARTPVRVVAPSPKPPPSYAKAVKKTDEDDRLDERNLERLTTRIKKMPVTRRTPPDGEKVYPIDLNLKNADLVEAIRVLGDTMGLNYNIDPMVKGTVNARASGKLTKSELLSIMETILTLNGATMIKNGELYNIVPADKAATRGVPVYSQGAIPPGMRAQVVFLEQTPVKEVVAVLKPLMSQAGNIGEAAHNSLVLVDNPDNLDKLLRLIYLMDTRALANTLVRIVKVHNTDPTEIITEMETIFSAYGNLAQKGKESFGVSFLPVARLNSVMILANSQPLAERALYWVRQLDSKTDLLGQCPYLQCLKLQGEESGRYFNPGLWRGRVGPEDQGVQTRTAAPPCQPPPLGAREGLEAAWEAGANHGVWVAAPVAPAGGASGMSGMSGAGGDPGIHGNSGKRRRRRHALLERAGHGYGRRGPGDQPQRRGADHSR